MSKVYPLDHPLGSACLKIERANVHINALYRSLRRTALDPKITFRKKGELHMPSKIPGVVVEGVDIYEMEVSPIVRESWGQIVGDILSNLRAALDHVAWALALKHVDESGKPLEKSAARQVTFPLYDSEPRYSDKGSGAQRALCHVLPSAHSTIEKFQPYNRTNWPELKFLAVLSELANEDKHRLVTPIFIEVRVRFPGEQQGVTMPLDKPGTIGFLFTDRVKAKLGYRLEPETSFDVVLYSHTYFPSYFSVFDFPLIHDFIRDEVVPAFGGFFP